MQLPGSAAWPAADARPVQTAQLAGQRIVALVRTDLRPSRIMTRQAFENAIVVNAAIGGSTNAVIHLLAIAGRLGVPLSLDDFDSLARPVPTLVNLMPSGRYLMEDFCYAGGVPAVMRELRRPAAHRARERHRPDAGREHRHRRVLESRGHQDGDGAAAAAGQRHGGATRQPVPGRCRDQAVRRVAAPAQAPRPGAGVRLHRGVPPGRRRPGPGGVRVEHPGRPRRGPARVPGHAGGRQLRAADQAAASAA